MRCSDVYKRQTQQQTTADQSVTQTVQQVNQLTGQIATLNTQISQLQGVGQDASAFEDQRDVAIGQLSSLIGVSSIKSDNSLTLTTANGAPLVVDGQSFACLLYTSSGRPMPSFVDYCGWLVSREISS